MQALLLLLAAAGALPLVVHGDYENTWTFPACIEDCITAQEDSASTGCCDGHVSWVDGMYDSPPCLVAQPRPSFAGARSGETLSGLRSSRRGWCGDRAGRRRGLLAGCMRAGCEHPSGAWPTTCLWLLTPPVLGGNQACLRVQIHFQTQHAPPRLHAQGLHGRHNTPSGQGYRAAPAAWVQRPRVPASCCAGQ
jgi:hypothetical protein